MKLNDENLRIKTLLFILVVLLKFPVLNLPHNWDSAAFAEHTMIIYRNNMMPLTLNEIDIIHPPAIFEIVAFLYMIFGESPMISHSVILVFSFFGVYFTYLLGSYLYNRNIGVTSALLLFFFPLYFAQSATLNLDIPMTALEIMTVYYLVRKNTILYTLSGSLLVLTKEPGILIIFAIFLYLLIYERPASKFIKSLLTYGLPFIVFFLFILYQKITSGYFLSEFHVSYFQISLQKFLFLIFSTLGLFFICLSLWEVLLLFFKSKKPEIMIWKNELTLLIIIVFIYGNFLSMAYMPRYALPLLPIIAIFFSIIVSVIFDKLRYIILVGILFLFIANWYGYDCKVGSCEVNMEYVDVINVHRDATRYIESNFQNSIVLTTWPLSVELNNPELHYVKTSIRSIDFRCVPDFNINDPTLSKCKPQPDLKDADIILYSPHGAMRKEFFELVKRYNATLIREFHSDGKYAAVYRIR